MPKNYLEIALKYHAAGYRTIPVNDIKAPAVSNWKGFMQSQTEEEVKSIFKKDCEGIALLMCDGLEAVDIDLKYDISGTLFNDYIKCVESFEDVLVTDLVIQSTVNNGFHAIYRCEETEGNKKLASRPATQKELDGYNAKVKKYNEKLELDKSNGKRLNEVIRNPKPDTNSMPFVLLETRGQGGYILIEPSDGYRIDQGNIFDIPTISPESRKVLWNAARSFNEIHAQEERVEHKPSKQKSGLTPLDDYNERADVMTLLKSHGWTEIGNRKDRIYFRRPGKERGNSGDYNTEMRLFKTWSTSTNLEDGKAYTPAALYTTLVHSGDFSAAAKDLYKQGYGQPKENVVKTEKELSEEDAMFAKLLEMKFDINKKPKNVDVILKIYSENECYDVGGLGMFGLIKGREKARKSTLGATLLASGISGGKPLMNMELKIGNKNILHIDTEQSDFFYYQVQKRTLEMGGTMKNHSQFHSFPVKGFTVEERIMLIDRLVDSIPNIGVIMLDGLVDLCRNFNNEEKASDAINKVLQWRDRSGAMVLGVMHMNRGAYGDTIGHLGAYANRKCDFSIEISLNKETEYSEVRPAYSRFRPFVGFEFTQDINGIPILNGSELNVMGNIEGSNIISRGSNDDDIPF